MLKGLVVLTSTTPARSRFAETFSRQATARKVTPVISPTTLPLNAFPHVCIFFVANVPTLVVVMHMSALTLPLRSVETSQHWGTVGKVQSVLTATSLNVQTTLTQAPAETRNVGCRMSTMQDKSKSCLLTVWMMR